MNDMVDAAATELQAMRGAWRALRREWELSGTEVAFLLHGRDPEGSRLDAATETRLRILIEIGYRLERGVDDDLCDRLRTPTPAFGWLSPLDAMAGSLADLRGVRTVVEAGIWA